MIRVMQTTQEMIVHLGTVDISSNTEPPLISHHRKNRGSQKVDGNGELEGQTILYVLFRFRFCQCADPSDRKKQDVESPGRDLRDKFYKHYRKEAEDYDKDFMKKYEENLDTTLIFVCCPHRSGAHVLIHVTGWPVLCRHFRLHHRGQLPVPARSKSRNRRSPPCHPL